MTIYRIWCDTCQNEYEIEPINEPVEEEELTPKCCPFCKNTVDDWLKDDPEE